MECVTSEDKGLPGLPCSSTTAWPRASGPTARVCPTDHILSNHTTSSLKCGGSQVGEEASMPPAWKSGCVCLSGQPRSSTPTLHSHGSARTSPQAALGRGGGQCAACTCWVRCPGPRHLKSKGRNAPKMNTLPLRLGSRMFPSGAP